ncbi:transcriptional activator NhaR [Candidatus Nitrospira bockiana]
MSWLNYHHLFYFWSVAKHGSVARACTELRLAQPTISGQIRALEHALGEQLFVRSGRRLVLTEVGRIVYRYAEEIFSLGHELTSALHGRDTGRPAKLLVGVSDAIPKLLTSRILEAAFSLPQRLQLVCWEDKLDRLLAELAIHGLDMVLADTPVPPTVKVQAFNHLIGESSVSLFATRPIARVYRTHFPASLDAAPFLLPAGNAALRRSMDDWFHAQGIRPTIRGEFDDSATLKAFGQAGWGIFPAVEVMEQEIRRQYRVEVVGTIPSLKQRFYAITVERRLKHPAVVAIFEAARKRLHG